MLMEPLFMAKAVMTLGIVSFNTSTIGGTGNDTGDIAKGAGSKYYGDKGADSIYFAEDSVGNTTIYGGNLSDATSSDGADTIHITGTLSSSYVTGNGGADTLYVGGTL